MHDPTKPHNGLPLLPPSVEIETRAVLKKAISARAALAELKAACHLLPNPAILMRSIVLQEAKTSSEIENIFTTHDELYRAAGSKLPATDPHTKEVLRYQDAVWMGYHHVSVGEPINTPFIVRLCQALKQEPIDLRSRPGTQIASSKTGAVVYTPPVGRELIESLLANLCDYIGDRDDEADPLVKLAVAHYQFEAIHPFPDGNGRTGRVLNILQLVQKKLLEWPVLYLSRFFIENRAEYYAGLRRVTEEGAWEDWVLFILDAIETTSVATRYKIVQIQDAAIVAAERARAEVPKVFTKELIELVFEQPYTRISHLEERDLAKRQTASVYLQALESIGLLRAHKVGRDVIYVNDALVRILSA
ncbi:MAG: Fic family protein [Chthonomonas sp.]|nr:Fic family protein [Chthonomonas sp.]